MFQSSHISGSNNQLVFGSYIFSRFHNLAFMRETRKPYDIYIGFFLVPLS